jgi:hypothetical protein
VLGENPVGEMEAVHADDDRIGFEQLEQLRRESALSGARSAGDAEKASVTPVRQAAGLLCESFDRPARSQPTDGRRQILALRQHGHRS